MALVHFTFTLSQREKASEFNTSVFLSPAQTERALPRVCLYIALEYARRFAIGTSMH